MAELGRSRKATPLTGSRWSGPIKLGEHRILSFKLGGGKLIRRVGLRLWVNGVAISSWGGEDSERLKQHHVDLSAYRGATIELELFDEASGMWGHILADDFVLYPDWESALRGE